VAKYNSAIDQPASELDPFDTEEVRKMQSLLKRSNEPARRHNTVSCPNGGAVFASMRVSGMETVWSEARAKEVKEV